ncbi:hypothetical protein V6N13_141248 [Hibiscus sabdariffa]
MALQASIFTNFALYHGVYMPTLRINIRGRGPPCMVLTNTASTLQASQPPANTHHEIFRPLADFPRDIWGDRFISLSPNNHEFKSSSRQVEVLKEKVKVMLMGSIDQVEKIMLINHLCRLGVSYHLENEIEEQLNSHFLSLSKLIDEKDLDLHVVATIFQVFRSHGYPMHYDVFNKFTDDDGEFKEELASDLKKIVVSYLVEAQWTNEGYLPTFDEYMEIALHSSAAILVIAQVLVGMEEADANAFQWLKNGDSKSLAAIKLIARLYDDIATNEDEEKRGLVACGTKCYMKQHGVSKEEAIQEFRKRVGVAWNELNEEFITRPSIVPMQILKRLVNIARVIDLTYKDEDGFTMSEKVLKHHISNVLIHPIPI